MMALIAGTICGFIFGVFKLPIPAPPTISGVLGIVGICIGYWIAK